MPFPLSGLNAVYSLDGSNCLALLEMADIVIDVDSVDAAGLGEADEFQLPVKRGTRHSFTVRQLNSGGVPCSNLDISVWTIGGTGYLASVKSGAIHGVIRAKDTSGIAAFDKVPAFRRRALEITTDRMVFSTSLAGAMASGSSTSLGCSVQIAFGVSSITVPMLLTAGKLTITEEETTMENVTLRSQGPATTVVDTFLLSAFFNAAQVAFSLETAASGGEVFETSEGQYGLITRLDTRFADGAVIKMEGTLEVQGAVSYNTN
jgi:hypothetical protein